MNNNKFILLFLTSSLLYWNPLSYYLLYKNSSIYEFEGMYYLFSFIFFGGLLLFYLITKNKLKEIYKNIVFALSCFSILFSIVVYLNNIVGFFNNNSAQKITSIFEPDLKVKYKTVEFEYIVETNNLGLREREIKQKKENIYRICCFGDSWTFGWGVQAENSWPRKLEEYLHNKGYDRVEVINCGRPGGYTSVYKEMMFELIPVLKPDVVLMGILQGDDLIQIYENRGTKLVSLKNYDQNILSILKNFINSSLSNVKDLFINHSRSTIITDNWNLSSNGLIKNFNHLQKIHFNMLQDTLQSLFISGNLNPGLLQYYINSPDRFLISNNPNHPATHYCIKEMDNDIKEIKEVCRKNECVFTIINLPENVFVGHKVIRTPMDEILYNFYIDNNNIDSIYNSLAVRNSVNYIQLTEHFVSLKDKDKYFYLYDGHPNKYGYEEIANFVGDKIISDNLLKNYF